MLSHWVQKAVEKKDNVSFLLVDRGHVRYKADNQHKFNETGPKFERIKIDIEHLNLGCVPSIQSSQQSVVAMGKHLCGAATDLALRCLVQTLTTDRLTQIRGDSSNNVQTPATSNTGDISQQTPVVNFTNDRKRN